MDTLKPHQVVTLSRSAFKLTHCLSTTTPYGVIWEATRAADGMPAALKFVNPETWDRLPDAQRDVLIRAQVIERDFLLTLAPWERGFVVGLLDHGEIDGLPVMALELMVGGELGAWIKAAQRKVAARTVLDWLGQVNAALGVLHRRGVRHLDLKPANVLLNADGSAVRLIDFGCVRNAKPREEHTLVGTPGFQAPEQMGISLESNSIRVHTCNQTDFFSMGLLTYFMVTGRQLDYYAQSRGKGAAAGQVVRDAVRAGTLQMFSGAERETFVDAFAVLPGGNAVAGRLLSSLVAQLVSWNASDRPASQSAISAALDAVKVALGTERPSHDETLVAKPSQRGQGTAAKVAAQAIAPTWIPVSALFAWWQSRRAPKPASSTPASANTPIQQRSKDLGGLKPYLPSPREVTKKLAIAGFIGLIGLLITGLAVRERIAEFIKAVVLSAPTPTVSPSSGSNEAASAVTRSAPAKNYVLSLGGQAITLGFAPIVIDGQTIWVQRDPLPREWRTLYCAQVAHSACNKPVTAASNRLLVQALTRLAATRWSIPSLRVVSEPELQASVVAPRRAEAHWVGDARGSAGIKRYVKSNTAPWLIEGSGEAVRDLVADGQLRFAHR